MLDSRDEMDESLRNTVVEVTELYIEHVDAEAGSVMLTNIVSAAVAILGAGDERLIRLLIRFGMFYQTRKDWLNARRFFEHALAASLSLDGPDHKRSEKLQGALDNEHYELEKQLCGSVVSVV